MGDNTTGKTWDGIFGSVPIFFILLSISPVTAGEGAVFLKYYHGNHCAEYFWKDCRWRGIRR